MKSIGTVCLGGSALILGALAFMAVFAFLASRFDYPAVLDGPASSVLPALLATGTTGRAVWAIYGFLPLIWLPAGVGAYHALRASHPGEFLGELGFSAFFVLSAWALLRSGATTRWVAAIGLLTGVMGWIGMLRNLTPAVAPVAAINNYLLPLWMIALGVILLRHREPESGTTGAR